MKKTSKKNLRPGECAQCQAHFSKSKILTHLKTCLANDPPPSKKPIRWLHIEIEGRYLKDYWLHVAIPALWELADLDQFLRDIWLECCGHLSGFMIDDDCYSCAPDDEAMGLGALFETGEDSMNVKLEEVLSVGTQFSYEYDYGSTTDLVLRVVDSFEAARTRGGVRILARNLPPEFRCAGCEQPATQLANGGNGLDPEDCYCDDCAKELDAEEQEMLMPIVNSPRVGVCGYCG